MSTVTARPGYIAEHEYKLHPALRFDFKPLDYESREKLNKAVRDHDTNPSRRALLTCSTIKQQLTAWEANQSHLFSHVPGDPLGDVLPLTVESIKLLKPALVDALYFVVTGWRASDPVPGATEAESDDFAATLIKAASEDMTPGGAAAEIEAGN